jgi:transmembrane sensor
MTASDEHKLSPDASKEEAFAWLMRLTSGEATTEDAAALERWRRQDPSNEAALVQASRLWRSVGPAVEQAERNAGSAGADRRPSPLNGAVLGRRAVLGGAVAAAAAYIVIRPPLELWPSFAELTSDYRTLTGEQRRIAIAGASVELNTQTSIDVRPVSDGADRIKLISGELAVATGTHTVRPVVVSAADGQASATEASFNMRYIASAVCITCLTGSVQVDCRGRMLTLQERQQVSYAGDGLGEAVTVDTAAVSSWQDGMLIFHNEPLSHVIDEINRYRPGRIVVMSASLGEIPVTARFKLSRLQDVVTEVQQSFGAHATRLPGDIILLSS